MDFAKTSTLSDSSEDDSLDEELMGKRPMLLGEFRGFDMPLTDVGDDSPPSSKKPRLVGSLGGMSDRSSIDHTDHSAQEDDYQSIFSDDENRYSRIVQEAKPTSFMDSKGQKMMERMGYKAGKGLGKHEQGRVDPIEVSKQRGRRGLGLRIEGLEAADLKWDSSLEVITVEETVDWLEDTSNEQLTHEELNEWVTIGPRKLTIDDETHFCDPKVLKDVLSSKSVFDKLEGEEMRKARTRSNPFETIRGAFFLNRAAMKMANMDRVFDFMFTEPVSRDGEKIVGPEDLLFFADVCAGPGGFSEYVLWRKKWNSKGFGFTLRNENDFKLADFYAGPSETFEPYYGVKGDGDVFDPDNIKSFKEFVHDQTGDRGVHFMMADGGFSVEGHENEQEILSKQLYLCQFLVAIMIVRTDGHFVCKLFDLFTPFSVGLVYLMYKAFHKISILKPNTSRPANSERYIICKWKKEDCDSIADHMWRINLHLCKKGDRDVTECVPLNILKEDEKFFNYIYNSNNVLGERQIINLVKIAAFCRDTTLTEPTQAEMRRKCLKYWEIPDKARTAPPKTTPDAKFEELSKLAKTTRKLLNEPEIELLPTTFHNVFRSVYDWHCTVIGSSRESPNCKFYLGLGRGQVYSWEGSRWTKVPASIEMSRDTLIYAELLFELKGEGKSQCKINTLNIIDALVLGGEDVSSLHLTRRLAKCRKFACAHHKPSRNDLVAIQVKQMFDLEHLGKIFEKLDIKSIKSASGKKRLVFTLGSAENKFFLPGGLLFFKATQAPWRRHLSRSTGQKYYAKPSLQESKYDQDRPSEACANFESSFKSRQVWWWEEGVQVHDSHTIINRQKVQRDQLRDFVTQMCLRAQQRP